MGSVVHSPEMSILIHIPIRGLIKFITVNYHRNLRPVVPDGVC